MPHPETSVPTAPLPLVPGVPDDLLLSLGPGVLKFVGPCLGEGSLNVPQRAGLQVCVLSQMTLQTLLGGLTLLLLWFLLTAPQRPSLSPSAWPVPQ